VALWRRCSSQFGGEEVAERGEASEERLDGCCCLFATTTSTNHLVEKHREEHRGRVANRPTEERERRSECKEERKKKEKREKEIKEIKRKR
jgi:hypothetical protein